MHPEEPILDPDSWQSSQKRYYEDREHTYLAPGQGGRYAEALVGKLWEILAVDGSAHGLEVGCGGGRFTLPLLSRCGSLEVLDLSRRHLDLLGQELSRREIAEERCIRHEGNLERIDEMLPSGGFDFVVGFHILHHLEDPADTLRRLRGLLRPGGRVAFLEPNRWNPLYLVQIALTPGMRFREERRMFQLGRRRFLRLMEEAGFAECRVERRGFFPPFVANRLDGAIALERQIEQLSWAQPVLPFLVPNGTRPA